MPVAIPLIALLPDILFVMLVIVFATGLAFFIVPPIVDFVRRIPFVGNALSTFIWIAFLAQQTALKGWVAKNVTPVVNLFESLLSIATGWLQVFLQLLSANLAAMVATAQAAGGQAGNVGQRIIQLAAQVAAQALSIGSLTDFGNGLWNRVTNVIQVVIPTAIGTAVTALQQLLHVGLAVEHQAMLVAMTQAAGVAQALFAQAQLAIKAGDLIMGELLAHTAATLAAEIVAVQTGAKVYTDGMAAQLQGQIGQLENVILPTALGVLGLEITQIATQIDTLERECINPACAALGAGLDLFQLLQQGIELLVIIDLVSTAIRDPQTTARELVQGADEIMSWVSPILGAFGVRT